MRSGPHDISFTLFGFPITIQPLFWLLCVLIMALSLGEIGDMQIWIAQVLVGTAGILTSILVHELGHALVFRYLFRTHCAIVLQSLGGVAIPLQHYQRGYGFRGTAAQCFLSFAGPLAGFVLAFLFIAVFYIVPANNDGLFLKLFFFFLGWTAFISIVWGILNLLPIYPMDGGHISREIFSFFFPRQGVKFSLVLSMTVAILLAAALVYYGRSPFAILFAFFAYQNYQELSFRSF